MESICLSQCIICALSCGIPGCCCLGVSYGCVLCVPLLTAVRRDPHPTIDLYLYPLLPRDEIEGFLTWASIHVHTPRGGCTRCLGDPFFSTGGSRCGG